MVKPVLTYTYNIRYINFSRGLQKTMKVFITSRYLNIGVAPQGHTYCPRGATPINRGSSRVNTHVVFQVMEEENGEVDVYDDEVLEVISLGESDRAVDENGTLRKQYHRLVQYGRHICDVYIPTFFV